MIGLIWKCAWFVRFVTGWTLDWMGGFMRVVWFAGRLRARAVAIPVVAVVAAIHIVVVEVSAVVDF